MFSNDSEEQRELNRLCYEIRGALFEVHKHLGPGLLESRYEEASIIEIEDRGMRIQNQLQLPVLYKGRQLRKIPRLDLLVEGKVLLELKSVSALAPIDFKKTMNYLRLSKAKIGFLVNFNTPFLKDRESIFRIVNEF